MTDSAVSPAGPAASDLLGNNSAPAAPPPAPSYRPIGFPEAPAAFDAPEAVAARAEIKEKIQSKEFYKSLIAERERGVTGPASQLWASLHAQGYPAPRQVASTEDVAAQQDARTNEQWNKYFAWINESFQLTPENIAELKAGVVRADVWEWAKAEKQRLIADRGWRRRFFEEGDRTAKEQWSRVTLLLGLKPVKPTAK
jgi:hypothetical protein